MSKGRKAITGRERKSGENRENQTEIPIRQVVDNLITYNNVLYKNVLPENTEKLRTF